MKITDGVDVLEITANRGGQAMLLNPTLIWDNTIAILADTGFPGQYPDIRAAMDKAGVPLSRLSKIILTHQDMDHIGGVQEILNGSDHKIEVLAHLGDKPYIEGDLPLLKDEEHRAEAGKSAGRTAQAGRCNVWRAA